MEYDPVGYFTSLKDAVDFVHGEWEVVHGEDCK
jgi:hypothetical protein